MAKTDDRRPVAGYLRVSTRAQAGEDGSLDTQERIVKRASELHFPGATVRTFTDEDSGRREARPSYQAMMADVRRRRFRAIICVSHDRLARNAGTFAVFLREIERTETALYCHNLGICSMSPAGKLVLQMVGACAEFESENISERTRLAWERRREEGMKGPGHRPFGWKPDEGGKLLPVEREQQAIRLSLSLHAKGDNWPKIADAINALGILSVTGKTFTSRSLRGSILAAARRIEQQS